ncbi:MAG: Fe-S cluster assembly ATPase SufC [Oscillospiraceae bacterium]|nr:Fe-S cluster assembly ATPase SufC [Oscillospiraceae bacterium]
MTKPLLDVRNLHVNVGEKLILRGLNLTVNAGETHVIMGQNGSGKSTLAAAIMGSPMFDVSDGTVEFLGEDITRLSPDKRAKLGVFLSFQNPEEIPGVTVENFLRAAVGAVTGETPRLFKFQKELFAKMDELGLDRVYASRELNVGFSGGEKKKTEILQLLMLNPKLAILDEADSGLDVDAVRVVSDGINKYRNADNAMLIITHNQRLVDDIKVDYVHVLDDKHITLTGGAELISRIADGGFAAVHGDITE